MPYFHEFRIKMMKYINLGKRQEFFELKFKILPPLSQYMHSSFSSQNFNLDLL